MTFTRVGIIVLIAVVAAYFGTQYLSGRHKTDQPAGDIAASGQPSGNGAGAPVVATSAASATPVDAGSSQAAATGDAAAGSAPASTAAATAGLSEEAARKIAEEVGRKVAAQVAASVVANSQPQAATEQPATESAAPAAAAPASDSAAASASPSGSSSSGGDAAPSETAAAAPQPEPVAPAGAPETAPAAEPAAAPEPAPQASEPAKVAASGSGKPAAAHHRPSPRLRAPEQSMDAVSVWWPAVDKQSDSQLNLVYAGEAASEKAAVLLFSDNIGNAAAAASHIQILDDHGKPADGHWDISPQNARMLVFATTPGRYTVILSPDLAGLSGKTLGAALHGPVYIQ